MLVETVVTLLSQRKQVLQNSKKKGEQKNLIWISETEEKVCTEQTKQQHANERNSGSGSIEK